jgi:CBS domain-containing protein
MEVKGPKKGGSMLVREIMTTDPICAVPDSTVQEIAQIMSTRSIGAVPVVADRRSRTLIGILTDRDIACRAVARGKDPRRTRAKECSWFRPMVPWTIACR